MPFFWIICHSSMPKQSTCFLSCGFLSAFSIKIPDFSLQKHLFSTSSVSVQKFVTHLLNNEPNIEKSLFSMKAKLDASSVVQVMERCCKEKPHMGLRFFIWAATQPSCRLSSYTYSKACDLLQFDRNPKIINDVIEAYGVENCNVSVNMFKAVLKLCREAKDADMGLWVLKRMKDFSCRPDTTAYNVVIRLFCERGEVEKGMELMREMGLIDLYPDMITYVSLSKGLCDAGKLEDACELIKVMTRHGCLPNVVVYTAIFDGICRFRNLDLALEFLDDMEKDNGGSNLNTVTFTAAIRSFCDHGRSVEALRIFHQMKNLGHRPNRVTMSTLIEGLCKDGHAEEANKFIDAAAGEYVSYDDCYSSLAISLCKIGKCQDAESILKMMLTRGFRIDGVASSVFIKWLCSEKRFLDAFAIYDGMEKSGNVSTIDCDIFSCLLTGLCQENQWSEVSKLLNLMVKKGVQLKAPHVDDILRYLKTSGDDKLVSYIPLVSQ